MNLELIKKLVEANQMTLDNQREKSRVAKRYYLNKNDILLKKKNENNLSPLRNADNRIPFSFYSLLVNQKASYLFTYPPLIDVQNANLNQKIVETLGDDYSKKIKDLCVEASNSGVAWVHFWINDAGFKWSIVASEQILPIFDNKLDKELIGVIRCYTLANEDGSVSDIFEYWDKDKCYSYSKDTDADINHLQEANIFEAFYEQGNGNKPNEFIHNFGTIPFIPFYNNNTATTDLEPIKSLIDAYDQCYSGFLNDLQDIQEVILVLTNYGGMEEDKGDLVEFLNDIKQYKTICLDNNGIDDKSGISKLNIEIPTEARSKMLEITRNAIFDMGQGIDPQQKGIDNKSGEAMKFLYSLLDLKAGLMETEFRLGLNKLVRAICNFYNTKPLIVNQTWTRNAIRNESEIANICSGSVGVISQKTILKNHPFVDDVESELKQLKKEDEENTTVYENFKNKENEE